MSKNGIRTLSFLFSLVVLCSTHFVFAAVGDGSVSSVVPVNDTVDGGPTVLNDAQFGNSMANIGDLDKDGVDDIAAGSPFFSGSQGQIQIMFMNADGSIKGLAAINSGTTNGPTLASGDQYGRSVAGIGDLNGDTVVDIVVGARLDHGTGIDQGTLHVHFMNTDGSVDSTVEINGATANGPTLSDNDRFGNSVVNLGDLDGDEVQDIAVGAYLDDNGGSGRGAVHIIFLNTDGSVKSTVEINSSTTNGPTLADDDGFGDDITSLGDLDGDEVQDIAVGALGDDEGGDNRGAVHIIFLNTDGSVKSTVEINSSTANGPSLEDVDRYGTAVANIGDINDDGVIDIAVGASLDDTGGTSRGAVHIHFMNTDGSVKSTAEINDTTSASFGLNDGAVLGSDIDAWGDYDSNGVEDFLVSAAGLDAGGTNRGGVYIIYLAEYVATNPGASGGGASDDITTSCRISDRTVTVDEEVDIEVSIEADNDPYTFKWTNDMTGSKTDFSHTFDTPGTYMLRGLAKDAGNTQQVVRCDTITVSAAERSSGGSSRSNNDDDNDTDEDDDNNSSSTTIVTPPTYTRDLTLGDTGTDVLQLQQFLNTFGYTIATEGPGAPGNETNYFGSLTQSALIRFQQAFSVIPATGVFTGRTRELISFIEVLRGLGIL